MMKPKGQEIEQVIQMAKNVSKDIVESGQKHIPVLVMITRNEVFNAMIPWLTNDNFKGVVGGLLLHFHAHAYIFVNEAWIIGGDKDSQLIRDVVSGKKKLPDIPLDDRSEALVIIAVENDKSYRMYEAKIRYTGDDQRYLDEWEEQEVGFILSGPTVLKKW